MRIWFILLLTIGPLSGLSRTFTVMVYNVENLFDIDGVSLFSDYEPDRYGPAKLATKLRNIAELVGDAGGITGPEVILFQEFEVDQTPDGSPFDYAAFLRRSKGRSVSDLLGERLDAKARDLPVEALLLKQFEDSGLATSDRIQPDGPLLTPMLSFPVSPSSGPAPITLTEPEAFSRWWSMSEDLR